MAQECAMAEVLQEAWRDFSLTAEQFAAIREDFAETVAAGLNGQPSPLQMLPSYVGRPSGQEQGSFLALDFGGTNLRVAEVALFGGGESRVLRLHRVSLRDEAAGYDYTSARVDVAELFEFIARQVALVAGSNAWLLGHSFSYPSRQNAIGRAQFLAWAKEIKVTGLAGQDINELLSQCLHRQGAGRVRPMAVLNDTIATLLTAAYGQPAADMGSVCGTGHNTCYYEPASRHGNGTTMAYNAESGGFDRLPFSRFDQELDRESEVPGSQRLEKMVAGRYLGELVRRLLQAGSGACGLGFVNACPPLCQPDGLSSKDVSRFVGDRTESLQKIETWLTERCPQARSELAERHFIKAVGQLVVERAATLAAASYAGFLRRIDPPRQKNHWIGVNGSLYEKMPGFAGRIDWTLQQFGGWQPGQIRFLVTDEAPLRGAAIAAAMAAKEE